MGEFYDPDSTLTDYLDIHLHNWAQDFRGYWGLKSASPPDGLSEADWQLARLLDQVGGNLVACARELRIRPELASLLRERRPDDPAEDAMQVLTMYQITHHRAEIDLISTAVSRLYEAQRRLVSVVFLLSDFELSQRAAAYVDRMIQCYIWGMDTEMTIMARTVLEVALKDAVPVSRMEALGYQRNRYGYEMWQYEEAAERIGLLGPAQRKSLRKVRDAGNDAVHDAPGLHPSVRATLRRTVECLHGLFAQSDPG